jgi:hypothetical protein
MQAVKHFWDIGVDQLADLVSNMQENYLFQENDDSCKNSISYFSMPVGGKTCRGA